MNKLTAAYLAGLIDGEAWIGLYKRKRKETNWYGYELTIANTDKGIIDWLKESFGGYIRIVEPKGNRKRQYWWILYNRKQVVRVLKKVKPYLKIKKEQAEILMKFLDTYDNPRWQYKRDKMGRIKSKVHPKELMELRDKLHTRIRKLNKAGTL